MLLNPLENFDMKQLFATLLVGSMFLTVGLLLYKTQSPRIIKVSNHEELFKAIKTAPEGSTVFLAPGTYHLTETLILDKTLHFAGEGVTCDEVVIKSTVTDTKGAPGDQPQALYLLNGNSRFRNMTFHFVSQADKPNHSSCIAVFGGKPQFFNVDIGSDGARAIWIAAGSQGSSFKDCRIKSHYGEIEKDVDNKTYGSIMVLSKAQFENCEVQGDRGISIHAGSKSYFKSCTVYGSKYYGVHVSADSQQITHATFDQCTIRDNTGPGIKVSQNGAVDMNDCLLHGNGVGALLEYNEGASATIKKSEFRHNVYKGIHIAIENSNHPSTNKAAFQIMECKIFSNGRNAAGTSTGAPDGVDLDPNTCVILRDCTISDNARHGLVIRENAFAEVEGCKIIDNFAIGICLWPENGSGIFNSNTLSGNNLRMEKEADRQQWYIVKRGNVQGTNNTPPIPKQ